MLTPRIGSVCYILRDEIGQAKVNQKKLFFFACFDFVTEEYIGTLEKELRFFVKKVLYN